MAHLVQRIHLIWFGSMLRNSTQHPHRRRLLEWRMQNPEWEVYLWTDRVGREVQQLSSWCQEEGIRHHSIYEAQVILWGTERNLVLEQLQKGYYANASDMLRLRLLYQLGGVYFDVDVEAISLPSIDLPLGIGLLLHHDDEVLLSVSPHAIAAIEGHTLLQIALWQAVQNFVLLEAENVTDFRSSEHLNEQYGATLVLTGDLFRPAFMRVFGVYQNQQWGWSPWLEAMQLPFGCIHQQENTWLSSPISDDTEPFYPIELGLEIVQSWNGAPLTSVLHWVSAYGEPWLIEIAAAEFAPFEDFFGFSPKGFAIKNRRTTEVLTSIPSM